MARILVTLLVLGLSLGSGLVGCSSGKNPAYDPEKEKEFGKKARALTPGMAPKAKMGPEAKGEREKSEPKMEGKAKSGPSKEKEKEAKDKP